ncbi:hypothetical protein [Nodosilinea nodulosa]|uniref:hypothetical protein n=1 Tax=Nodosilinea nodulosa TaxID=416001 RepID=UPI00036B3B02|nr:hypothetical protein [Nodosilinea nodulosa]
MKTHTTHQLMAGLLTISAIGLLRSPSLMAFPIAQVQSSSEQSASLSYQGSWQGTFRTVGSQGQIIVFIDPSGNLYGSLEANDGGNFAQISGHHCGNTFYLTFTPPPSSLNQFGTAEPYSVEVTATWEQGMNQFVISAPTQGHFILKEG